MNVNFLFITKEHGYVFENVDLADLVTLISWNRGVDVETLRDVLGKETDSESSRTWGSISKNPQEIAAYFSAISDISIEYLAVEGSFKAPQKVSQNITMGDYFELLPDGKMISAMVVVDISDFSFKKPSKEVIPTRPHIRQIENDIESGIPVLLKNTEPLGLESGVYYKGAKVK